MKLSMKLYAAVLGAGVTAISAANAEVRTEVQFAVGTSYQMPAGDFSAGTGAPIRETERRKAAGERRLRELKAREGSHGDTDATPSRHGDTDAPSSLQATIQGPSGHSVITGASGGCKTNSTTQYAPSDIHGAVGLTTLVVVTNVDVGVYAKSNCALISRVPLTTLFGKFNIPSTRTLFDPRVLYDPSVDRFLITADSDDSTNTDQYQYFAVSSDETTGISWYAYSVMLSHGQGQGASVFCKNDINDFWDYPSAGSSSTRRFITANDFGNVNATGAILSIDKLASITAQTTNSAVPVLCLNGLATNLAPPIVAGSTAYFLSDGGNGFGNAILSYALTVAPDSPWYDALAEPVSIPVPSWSAAPQAPQPNGQNLDTLDGRFQSASIQTGTSLWNVHTINVRNGLRNYARWRLYQFSTATNKATVLATPTTSDCANCDHLFNPSVAVSSGKAFVTASRTMPSKGTAGYAAMLIFSGPSTCSWGLSCSAVFNRVATSGTQFVSDGFGHQCNRTDIQACRWGDYSATQIDPLNPASAWGFNQVITGSTEFNWTTDAAQVQ
jgi:hypothetical protein